MNEVAQRSVVRTVRNRLLKRWQRESAITAKWGFALGVGWNRDTVATNAAERHIHATNVAHAVVAHGNSGNFNQGRAAETALGGKQYRKNVGRSAVKGRSD